MEPEALNKKALDIVHRVRDKLTGRDFQKEVTALSCVWHSSVATSARSATGSFYPKFAFKYKRSV